MARTVCMPVTGRHPRLALGPRWATSGPGNTETRRRVPVHGHFLGARHRGVLTAVQPRGRCPPLSRRARQYQHRRFECRHCRLPMTIAGLRRVSHHHTLWRGAHTAVATAKRPGFPPRKHSPATGKDTRRGMDMARMPATVRSTTLGPMETAPSERDNDSDLQRVDRLRSTALGDCLKEEVELMVWSIRRRDRRQERYTKVVWTGTRGPREDGHARWWRGSLESRCDHNGTLDSGNRRHALPRLGSPAWSGIDQHGSSDGIKETR